MKEQLSFFSNAPDNTDTDINLTPLIDIVFLLLIFFMLTTSFQKNNALDVSLPTTQKEAQKEKDRRRQARAEEKMRQETISGDAKSKIMNKEEKTRVQNGARRREFRTISTESCTSISEQRLWYQVFSRIMKIAEAGEKVTSPKGL